MISHYRTSIIYYILMNVIKHTFVLFADMLLKIIVKSCGICAISGDLFLTRRIQPARMRDKVTAVMRVETDVCML